VYKNKIKNLGLCVCSGAKAKCSFGEKEVDLSALPLPLTPKDEGNAQLSVMDFIPFLNIPAFGKCKSPANPMNWKMAGPVPVFVPSSCLPITMTPWSPGAKKLKILGGNAALLEDDKCMCMWAGQIEITDPGQKTVKAK
jgi:hypothetical protein